MKKVLFLFWHGLGDNILATPAIRQYKKSTGDYIGWMMMERIMGADLFIDNYNIDRIHGCQDAWHCCGKNNIQEGSKKVIKEAQKVKEEYGYDKLVVIDHKSSKKHKIYRTADEMGISIDGANLATEFSYQYEDIESIYDEVILPKEYVFFNGITGVEDKNLPLGFVQDYMKNTGIDLPIVSPDFTWDVSQYPIAFAADVMSRAKYIFVADSALYHIAHALRLDVDLAYFQRGDKVWNVVHPLHGSKEHVVFEL